MTDDITPQGAAAVADQRGDGTRAVCDRVAHQGLFPEQPAANDSKGRLAFFLVLICYALIDYGRLQWIPRNDTGGVWHVFYASYAELFYHHDLAHWFPYGLYGQPNTLHNLMLLAATDYLMMMIGKVFHIKNALVLFQLSLMAGHLLFLFGIQLLSRSIFRRRSAVWLCLIGSITSLYCVQLTSIQAFRPVGWYPLILYFLVRFFRDRKAAGLWVAGILFTFSCPGIDYLPPYLGLSVLPFVAVGTWKHFKAWRNVFSCDAGNLVTMIVFAIFASLYLYTALHVIDGVGTLRPGRNSSGVVDVGDYAGGGGAVHLWELLISLFCGHADYVGLLPLGCVLWGLFRVRTPLFTAFMASALILVWFAMGGMFSLVFYYHVPFFSRLHFLFLGLGLVHVPLLLAAGAAWDAFTPSGKNLKVLFALPVIILFSIDFCLYCDNFPLTPPNAQAFFSCCRWAFIKLAVYGGLLGLAWILSLVLRSAAQSFNQRWQGFVSFRSLATVALLTGLFVDVFQYSYRSGLPGYEINDSYRGGLDPSNWRPVNKSSPIYQACHVQPLTWQAERLDQPDDERKKAALQIAAFFTTYAFAQFDPCQCQPEFPILSIGTAMQKLLALRDKNDPALQTILGCHAPKLRLLTQALYVNNEAEAAAAVRSHGDLTNVVILQVPSNFPRPPMPHSSPARSPGSVRVTDFGANAIEIYVNVTVPEGAWLVYADTFDPRWRAWINGQPAPILPAYVGLKAVRVPYGESMVQMKFSTWSNVGMRVLALGGAICSLSLLLYCGLCCVRGFPSSRRKLSETTLPTPAEESVEPVQHHPETLNEQLKPQMDPDERR